MRLARLLAGLLPLLLIAPALAAVSLSATLEALSLPPDCRAERTEQTTRVRCAGDRTLVEARDRAAALDTQQSEVQTDFAARGAGAATIGSPDCTVTGQPAECAFVAARSGEGLVGTAYLATGDGWSLRCVYYGEDRYYERADPVCHHLLKVR